MGVFPFLGRGAGKVITAKVTTMDADLDKIVIEANWTGRHLFDAVCRIIGLREVWFFGLQFTNKKSIPCWLQMDKEIRRQEVPKADDGSYQFLFLVKFFPEDVEEELIQDLTRHLFFVQIKQSILSMQLYCSPEASVLLASFAVQAIHGDCSEEVCQLDLDRLLPTSVIDQYDMSAEMWRERIKRWWMNNHGQTKEDAEMEYLRVAQDLEMYGVLFYPICNKKETDLHLGISAQGLGIYKGSNRITPRPFFSWSEIKNISFRHKKFLMKTMDNSTISFRAQDQSINPSILDLCIGTHNLYLRRRKPDTLEVQQMKAQAKEERARRQQEAGRLTREREDRVQAETERNQLRAEVDRINEQLSQAKDTIRKTEETAELMAEKARASEQETLSLAKKASEAEAECHRLKLSHIKSEETMMLMERKAREAELYAQRISMSLADVNGEGRNQMYASHSAFGDAGGMWPMASLHGAVSHHQLMTSTESDARPMSSTPYRPPLHMMHLGSSPPNQFGHMPPPDPPVNQLKELHNIVEKSRLDFAERSRQFKERLADFRSEIENLKREDRQTENDVVHARNVHNGFDKMTTLRMSKSTSSLESYLELWQWNMSSTKRPAVSEAAPSKKMKSDQEEKQLLAEDFYALEDRLSREISHEEMEKAFLKLSTDLKKQLMTIVDGSKESPDMGVMLQAAKMRRISRMAQYSTAQLKKESHLQLAQVEDRFLQLQNVKSEIQHVQKEIKRCLQYSAGDEDIELVPEEEFYGQAPESVSQPETTKSDEHAKYLARLNWELQQRQQLVSTLSEQEIRRSVLSSACNGMEQRLKSLKPKIDNLIKAAKPVQELLGVQATTCSSAHQRSLFALLPNELSVLFVQAEAHNDIVKDSSLTVKICGTAEQGNEWIRAQLKEQEDEIDGNNEGGHERRDTTVSSRLEKNLEGLTRTHPIHLQMTVGCKDDVSVIMTLRYMPALRSTVLKYEVEGSLPSYGSICSPFVMFDCLFPDDDGSECPDPVGAAKLQHLKLSVASFSGKLGRPYKFVQQLTGASPNGQQTRGVQLADVLQTVVSAIQTRIVNRQELAHQLVRIDKERSSAVLPAGSEEEEAAAAEKMQSQLKSFKQITEEEYLASLPSAAYKELSTGDFYFDAQFKNKQTETRTIAYILVPARYPLEHPRLTLALLRKDSETAETAENSSEVQAIEQLLNVDCLLGQPQTAESILTRQLYFLAIHQESSGDVAME